MPRPYLPTSLPLPGFGLPALWQYVATGAAYVCGSCGKTIQEGPRWVKTDPSVQAFQGIALMCPACQQQGRSRSSQDTRPTVRPRPEPARRSLPQ